MEGGSVLHTGMPAPFHHIVWKLSWKLEGWKVGRLGGWRVGGGQEMDRVIKGEGRKEKGVMTELKALCLYMRLKAN